MRGIQSCASLFVIPESCIREELSFLNRVRKFTTSAICNASNTKGDEGGRKGRTQELLEALTPSEAKVTASESELEEASKRHVVCGVHSYLNDICNELNGHCCAGRKSIADKR